MKEEKLDIYAIDRDNPDEIDEFIEQNTGLVHSIAHKLMKPNLEFEDLTQEGLIALYISIMNFDTTKGYAFSTYAYPTIYGTIQKYIRDKQSLIRLPRRIYFNYAEYLSLIEDEENKKMIENFSEKEMKEITKAHYMYKTSHLDLTINSAGTTLQAILEDDKNIEEDIIEKEEYESVIKLIDCKFGEREKNVLKYREEGLSQEEIANKLGLSQASISRSLKKIKELITNKERYVA